ncbi:MAG TPA: MtrB/PioB family outer membrane beta-barrel protein [Vicinamibacterales bacterium]
MRNIPMIAVGALLLVSAVSAQEQQQAPAPQAAAQTATPASSFTPKIGKINFGFRFDDVTGDPARYQRFRDLGQGGVLDFAFNKENETSLFTASAFNVGYRDQAYTAAFQKIGKLKANFEWNQVPLYSAEEQKSLYTRQGSLMSIDNAVQQSIQNATALGNAARDAAINTAFAGAGTTDLRSRRDIAAFDLAYALNRDIDFKFNLKNTMRTGSQVMAFGFGTSPGLNPAVEFGVPLDDRTTDVKGALEFANTRGLLSVGYTGSWYNQNVPFVQFDNPLRATDINNGTSIGQVAWWPTNSSFAINANGAYTLAPRTRASIGMSVGRWSQNEALPPPTVNTALTDAALGPHIERTDAEAEADIKSIVFNLNSRPNEMIWLNAKYRYYDYANKTPLFESTNAVIGDWGYGTQIHETEPASFKRNTLDLDASFSPVSYFGFGAGYTRETGDRTYRIYEKTEENTFRLTADSTGNQYVTVRLKYEHGDRKGSGFEEELLAEVGEQSETRHYDIANRKRDRFTTTVSVTPTEKFALNGSVSTGKDNYDETGFGLRDNKNDAWSLGFDVYPIETVSFGLNYGREKYTANQYSRTANPLSATDVTFNDPTRDWSLDQDDTVKTFSANLDLLKALPKTDVRFTFDLSDGEATYVYGGPATTNPAIFGTIPLKQLMPVTNKLTDFRADLQHFVRANVALGLTYWYEEYKVEDFALGEATLNAPNPVNGTTGVFASTIYSGYLYRPYKGNNISLRMTYLW